MSLGTGRRYTTGMETRPVAPPNPPALANEIIAAEHGYIAQTAFQANEDRARASQYFFVTFATLIAALLSVQIPGVNPDQLYLTFVVIFVLLAILGFITILQLVRLRQAWLESVRAMNQIKEQVITRDPTLASYFRWRADTVPPAFKLRSLGFLQAVSVALLSGLSLGAAVAFGALVRGAAVVPWGVSILTGLLCAVVLLAGGYVWPLSRAKE
ncbi:MAG: hypothetical protein R3C44_11685 [Chloroflexota bacterium]